MKERWELSPAEAREAEYREAKMPSTRLIPDAEVPAEQTNASLRKLLREAHGRERFLSEENQRLRECLQWVAEYLSGHCVISSPKRNAAGVDPESAILSRISQALSNQKEAI